jgi:hypothetical protein
VIGVLLFESLSPGPMIIAMKSRKKRVQKGIGVDTRNFRQEITTKTMSTTKDNGQDYRFPSETILQLSKPAGVRHVLKPYMVQLYLYTCEAAGLGVYQLSLAGMHDIINISLVPL